MERLNSGTLIIITLIGSLFLLAAQTSFWAASSFFDKEYFVNTVVRVLQEEPVRRDIAEQIVNKTLSDRPILQSLAGEYIVPVLSGILGSDQFKGVLNFSVGKFYDSSIDGPPKDLSINVTTFKQILGILAILTNDSSKFDTARLPDQIIIIPGSKIPDFHTILSISAWAGPIFLILGLVFLFVPIYFAENRILQILRTGIIIAVSALIFYALVPYISNIGSIYIPSPGIRTIFMALYSAFTESLASRLLMQAILGFLIVVIAFVIKNKESSNSRRHPRSNQ